MRGILPVISVAALTVAGCRYDATPFEAADRDRPDTEEARAGRLTFSPRADRSPVWSLAGDSIYYSAEGINPLPSLSGVLVGVPAQGGVARPILTNVPSVDLKGDQWLVTPSPDPTGGRLGFVEIRALWDPDPCPTSTPACVPTREGAPLPPLRQLRVHVRSFEETGPLEESTRLDVDAPGVDIGRDVLPVYTVRVHPFQRLFELDRAFTFRVTWAPDGERLAFSDGLRILIWTVGADQADPVPNTEDGAWPAWSPDGEWIAFTRIERADSVNSQCTHIGALGPNCEQVRTDYIPGRRVLNIIRPDGSGPVELADGDESAWAPDNQTLYFRHRGQIWRTSLNGSGPEVVPDTEAGHEPAVSPDGTRLAFAKIGEGGNFDIWVIPLNQ